MSDRLGSVISAAETLEYKQKRKLKLSRLIGLTIIIIIGFIMIYPLIWMFFSSFKQEDIIHTGRTLLPETWTWENYRIGWQGVSRVTFGRFFWNSFVIASTSTIGVVLSSSLVAFSFSRGKYRSRKTLFALSLGTLMLPAQVLMIPNFLFFNNLGWIGSYRPLIIPAYFALNGFFVFLMTNFMNGIPKELDEAAKIDGCSFFGIYARIVIPLSVPALITASIFSFMWRWDDFMGPLLYLNRVPTFPASYALRAFADATGVAEGQPQAQLLAMGLLSLIPLFLIFFLLQRYLVEGIATTGLKG